VGFEELCYTHNNLQSCKGDEGAEVHALCLQASSMHLLNICSSLGLLREQPVYSLFLLSLPFLSVVLILCLHAIGYLP
jgi:hypothetical protein